MQLLILDQWKTLFWEILSLRMFRHQMTEKSEVLYTNIHGPCIEFIIPKWKSKNIPSVYM